MHSRGWVLGAGAGAEEIRRAYRRAALRMHPDKNPAGRAQFDPFMRQAWVCQVLRLDQHRPGCSRSGTLAGNCDHDSDAAAAGRAQRGLAEPLLAG